MSENDDFFICSRCGYMDNKGLIQFHPTKVEHNGMELDMEICDLCWHLSVQRSPDACTYSNMAKAIHWLHEKVMDKLKNIPKGHI